MSQIVPRSHVLFASLGALIAVSALAYASTSTGGLMLLGSFGASSLLLFSSPEAALSQPRSVIGGHCLASIIAICCLYLFGPHWWAIGLATGLAVAAMMITRTLHPPAGSNAIIVFLAKPTVPLLVGSTVSGAVSLVLIAFLFHRMTKRHQYPVYWHKAPIGQA